MNHNRKSVPFDRLGLLALSLVFFQFFLSSNSVAQLAQGEDKYLGNIIASSIPANFSTYWNQITPENAGKWGSVESTRDSMSWGNLDTAYNYAQSNGFHFKQHVFVWGSQEPGWIGSLSQAEQLVEVEEWIQQYCQRYPDTDSIDVVNEPLHAPASYREALGGDGSTGWDWVIWSFEKARQYCPNAKLYINDYGIINDGNAINQYKQIITLLQQRGLIDGIGIQAHAFNVDTLAVSTIQNNLNSLSDTGLPIYVSELDIRGSTEQEQRDRYAEKFPLFWEHPSVAGVTLWGYVEGQTWLNGTGILNSDGSERLAMEWLKTYFNQGDIPDVPSGSVSCELGSLHQWGSGFVLTDMHVNNDSNQSISSWQVVLTFTQAINVINGWSGQFSLSADGRTLTVSNVGYNGNLNSGASATFGFQGQFNGPVTMPECVAN
ncbi:MAG: endo-1,4-beta-xylanase [Spongiibacteraceae bacterium]|nr:endo-1,4-beta-xylanase [Spongiibacteraceae bacterium]